MKRMLWHLRLNSSGTSEIHVRHHAGNIDHELGSTEILMEWTMEPRCGVTPLMLHEWCIPEAGGPELGPMVQVLDADAHKCTVTTTYICVSVCYHACDNVLCNMQHVQCENAYKRVQNDISYNIMRVGAKIRCSDVSDTALYARHAQAICSTLMHQMHGVRRMAYGMLMHTRSHVARHDHWSTCF